VAHPQQMKSIPEDLIPIPWSGRKSRS